MLKNDRNVGISWESHRVSICRKSVGGLFQGSSGVGISLSFVFRSFGSIMEYHGVSIVPTILHEHLSFMMLKGKFTKTNACF